MQISLRNFSEISKKFSIYKGLPQTFFNDMPYYEYQDVIEEWAAEIKAKKEHQEKESAEIEKSRKSSASSYTPPKINLPKLHR